MKFAITTLTILMALPGLALAAPAPRDGWKTPYPRPRKAPTTPTLRALPRRTAPKAAPRLTPLRAAPRRAVVRVPPRRLAPRTTPRNARARAALPTPRPVMPLPPDPLPEVAHPTSTTLHRRRRPEGPQRMWHLRLTAQSHNLLVRHASFNPLKVDDLLSQGGLAGGMELTLLARLVVGAEVGWVGGGFTGSLFGSDTTNLKAHSLRMGVRVGYRLWDAVTPYVRGGFAATWLAARVYTDTQTLGGRSFAPGAYGLAGVEFTIRRSWMRKVFGSKIFTMGLVFEAGWVHLGQFNLEGGKNTSGLVDDYRAGLGRLTLTGVTVNAGLVLAF